MKIQQKVLLSSIKLRLKFLLLLRTQWAAAYAFKLFCTPLPTTRKQRIPKIILEGVPQTLLCDGKKLSGFQFNKGKKNKVLILHGFSSSLMNFHNFISAFVAKDYEVLCFDAPAHGASEGKQVNAVDYKDMILAIVAQYGPINKFLAHSFGGIALSLAAETIPLPADCKIVFIAPATETTSAIESVLKILAVDNKKLKNAIDAEILKRGGQITGWYSIRRAIKNIDAEVLWIHDTDDDVTPFCDVEHVMNDNHAHVEFMITTALGHRQIYKNDAVKTRVVSFL